MLTCREHALLSISAISHDFTAPAFPFLLLQLLPGLSGFVRTFSCGLCLGYVPTDAQR